MHEMENFKNKCVQCWCQERTGQTVGTQGWPIIYMYILRYLFGIDLYNIMAQVVSCQPLTARGPSLIPGQSI